MEMDPAPDFPRWVRAIAAVSVMVLVAILLTLATVAVYALKEYPALRPAWMLSDAREISVCLDYTGAPEGAPGYCRSWVRRGRLKETPEDRLDQYTPVYYRAGDEPPESSGFD